MLPIDQVKVTFIKDPQATNSVIEQDEAETSYRSYFFVLDYAHIFNWPELSEMISEMSFGDFVREIHHKNLSLLFFLDFLAGCFSIHGGLNINLN